MELPGVGKRLEKGKEAAVVESVKAASEIYAPADGEVTAVNEALADELGRVNGDAEGNGWFFKMKLSNPGQVGDLIDRKSGGSGKGVSVRLDLGGSRTIKKKKR